MRKVLAASMAALTLGGAVATALPADAAPHGGFHGGRGFAGHGYVGGRGYHGGYYRGGYYRGGGYGWGVPLAAGLAGLAVGSALAGPYYGGYYAYPGYAYGPGYCETGHWAWDPYAGRDIWVRTAYPC